MDQIANHSTKTVQQLSWEVVGALADALKVDFQTIKRWVKKNDIRLTSDPAKEVFARKGIIWNGEETVAVTK